MSKLITCKSKPHRIANLCNMTPASEFKTLLEYTCTINTDKREPDVFESSKFYSVLVVDKRFEGIVGLFIARPYIYRAGKAVAYAWMTDNGYRLFQNITKPVVNWENEVVLAFSEDLSLAYNPLYKPQK